MRTKFIHLVLLCPLAMTSDPFCLLFDWPQSPAKFRASTSFYPHSDAEYTYDTACQDTSCATSETHASSCPSQWLGGHEEAKAHSWGKSSHGWESNNNIRNWRTNRVQVRNHPCFVMTFMPSNFFLINAEKSSLAASIMTSLRTMIKYRRLRDIGAPYCRLGKTCWFG